ncbi:hypothetical protein [Novosphingobium sp. P6W]|uniref:hypothetical protein n=1 Tax=Novosphingobium sp. P6W TaxID=1609758 RepID=UPI0005C32254|nr:hypothetical protein [Novosphingobium sp. P6W]AXB77205.1 hypothetical protein TQ38_012470 [Novosphingobium sp. P6W]KIS30847.1 hypothetical protein TQ38_19725 [Novosphingobium sp. P6W]
MKRITVTASIIALTVLAGSAQAQTPSSLNDLVGARAVGAEAQMQSRGYSLVKTEKGDDRSYTYWWNASTRQCVTVATMEGRYDSITSTLAPDCGQQADRHSSNDNGRYRPNPGYSYDNPSSNQRQSPSYVEDRDRGGDRYQVDGRDVDLGLVCFGDGQRPGFATTYGYSWNSRTRRYDYGNRTEMTGQQFDASVMIQLWPGGGHIRLPKKLVPPINSRGNDGWWDLYDVEMGPDVIRAKYRLNGLNKPLITINRRSGQISIKGTDPYAFRGGCDLIDGEDHRRF